AKNEYRIGSHTLKETTEEKDLGVIVSNNLKWNKQCIVAAAKANRILGQIKSSFVYLDRQIVRLLYTGLVRPHLEYAVSVWCPSFKSDISILDKVQRRATKLVKSIKDEPYDWRLNFLNLQNLEERGVRGDLIQMYKLIRDWNPEIFQVLG
ncbi:unnamed protein product, partial [Brachionus calyciflorus]